MDIIRIEALGDSAEARQALARADVIIGVDESTQRAFTVFGTPSLEESFRLGRGMALRTLRVGIDASNGGLEKLVALVKAVKGRHDYFAGDE
jgi:hypothetical protein